MRGVSFFFRSIRGIWICWLVVFFVAGYSKTSFCKERIPTPSWMEPVLVAEKMIVNGLPTRVSTFKVEKPATEVLQFYQERWQKNEDGKNPGYALAQTDPWSVISRLERKRYLLTVQVRATSEFASTGFLAEADVKSIVRRKNSNIPMLRGSTVVNETTSYDPGKKATTVLLTNNQSVQANSQFYKQYYTERNWSSLLNQQQKKGHVLFYQGRGKETHIVINGASGATQVVVTYIENK